MLACRRLKICSCSSLGTLDNLMTWKNRPFIATNFLVVCILSLQDFAQNMTLAKTEKKTTTTKTKQNKTKRNETKQNKTKQNKTKQNKTKQNKTKQNKTKQNKKTNQKKKQKNSV